MLAPGLKPASHVLQPCHPVSWIKTLCRIFPLAALCGFVGGLRADPAGSLDTSFNATGYRITAVSTGSDGALAAATQSDGKIVVVGPAVVSGQEQFAVVRYNTDGSLDTTFGGGDGIVTTNATANPDQATSVALQSDGKIVVGGYDNVANSTFVLVRYLTDGTLDTTFDTDGIVVTDITSSGDSCSGVVVQSDGKIVAAGTANSAAIRAFTAVRYNTNGSLDTSFDGDGIVTLAPIVSGSPADFCVGVVRQTDGKIILGGGTVTSTFPSGNYVFAVARLNTNGSLDTTYSGDGKQTAKPGPNLEFYDDIAYAMTIQSDNKVLITGWTEDAAAALVGVARFTTTGALDTTFSGDGVLTTSNNNMVGAAVLAQSDGKIVVGSGTSGGASLIRYTSTGGLDTTFSGDGFVTTAIPGTTSSQINALRQQSNGRLIAAGSAYSSGAGDFLALRYLDVDTVPDIAVEQPVGTNLVDGSATVAFGSTPTGTPVIKTFTVRNTGASNLTGLAITKDGANAADFTVGALGSTTLAPSASTTFDVTFNPAAGGAKTAAIHVASNDPNENPFDINLSGTGTVPVPEIVVEEPLGTGLTDNASTVDFGGIAMTTSIVKTFTVKNMGSANLTGLAVSINGTDAAEFAVGALGATTVPPTDSTTFTVTFSPLTLGAKTAAIHIASNDADENPFDVALAGTGGPAPITPVTVKATSYWSAGDGNHINIINGLGLSGGGSVLTQTHGNSATANGMWHAGPNDGGLGGPTGSPPTVNGQAVEFDLGANYDLATSHIWNHNQSGFTNRGVKDFQIWVSPATTGAFTQIGTYLLNQAPGTAGLAAQVFTTSTTNVRRVQIRVQTIWAGTSTGYTGLSEVRFAGVLSVPEIALHDGSNTAASQLADGQAAVVDFGYTAQGTAVTRDFTISNTGTASLTVSSITAPSGYTVLNVPGAAIVPATTHTFQVRLDAASTGTFSGSVTVNSDDADEAAFDFPITGVVQNAPFHNWAAGSGLSGADLAPTANPANDGVSNLLKYAFNMDPTMPDVTELTPGTGTSGLPTYDTTGSGASSFFRFEFIRRIGSGLIYTPKKSPDLLNWSNLTSTPTVTGIDANWERVVHLEPFDGTVIVELFGRVEVTLP